MEYSKLKELVLTGEYTEEQIKEIRTIADIRLGNYSARESNLRDLNKSSSETYAVLFHAQLKQALSVFGISLLPYLKLKSIFPKAGKGISQTANFLFAISEEWNKDKKRSRSFTVGVFYLYCKLVIDYLQEKKVPVSLKTCLQHTDKFVGLVDKAFPGYVESGMINVVILRDKTTLKTA